MPAETPKRAVFEHFARVAHALAHPSRLELLEILGQGERSVEAAAQLCSLKLSNASQHLQLLRRAGLVEARKAGTQVRYRLADRDVVDLTAALRRTAERGVAAIAQVVHSYFHQRESLEAISQEDLLERLRLGVVTVLDVRPAEEFAAGHIPGAINIPVPELMRDCGSVPKHLPVVAYCRGPYCALAFEAVTALRAQGYDVRRLRDGFPDWWAAGRPVELRAPMTGGPPPAEPRDPAPRTPSGAARRFPLSWRDPRMTLIAHPGRTGAVR